MKITYFGHSSFHIDWNGINLVFDPFISGNPGASHIDINDIKADYILISHGHQDHILDVETIASNNPEATLISNWEIYTHFTEKGIRSHPMNIGGKFQFSSLTIKYVNAIHSSSFPDGSYAGNPGGFVIWDEKNCIYFAGDTALHRDMRLISRTCPKLDLAILPIGDNFTMGIDDALLATKYIKCDKIIGCHYDTFPPITIDKQKARAKFDSQLKKLILLEIGASHELVKK